MGRKFHNIEGERFKNLLVIKISHRNRKDLYWECKCDCGETCYATSGCLKRGRTNYCKKCNDRKSRESVFNLLYSSYKRNALKRGYEFNLTASDVKRIINQNCHYCGFEPNQVFYKKGMIFSLTYNGIDRKDNEIGYTVENSVPCCKFCNLAKSRFKVGEFQYWLNRIRKL